MNKFKLLTNLATLCIYFGIWKNLYFAITAILFHAPAAPKHACVENNSN